MDDPFIGYMTDLDRQVLAALGHGARQGFGRRPALLIVDTNYEFCGDAPRPILEAIRTWPAACGEAAWAAVAVMRRLIDSAHAAGLPVFYSTNTRRPDGFDSGSWAWKGRDAGANAPRERPPRADDIVDEIAPEPQDVVVHKTKPSVFYGTPFDSFLVQLQVDSLLVCGGTTSGCVRATVVDAFARNLRCAVVADACFDRFETSHAVTLVDLHHKYADVTTAEEVVAFVGRLPAGQFELPRGRP